MDRQDEKGTVRDVETKELCEKLGRYYIQKPESPGGVFLTEVTGAYVPVSWENDTTARRIDALYIGFSASRGRYLEGHEIKVSRGDWLAELRDAHKASWWFERTHRWWVVAGEEGIVKPEELPEGWGLMTPGKSARSRLRVVVEARMREPLVDVGLVVELARKLDIVRRVGERKTAVEIDQLVRQGVERRLAEMDDNERGRHEREAQNWREAKATFEEASGLRITSWDAGRIGEAVKKVVAQDQTEMNHRRSLETIKREAKRLVEDVEKSLERLGGAN